MHPASTLAVVALDKAVEVLQFDFSAPATQRAPASPLEPARLAPQAPVGGPGSSSDDALTVAELYERVQLALRLTFPEDVWITGEIRKVAVGRNGHRYIELADHLHPGEGSKAGAATLEVACWNRDWPTIAGALDSVGIELRAGLIVRVLGRVGTWPGASKLRVTMTALDVEALVGGIAAARRKLLKELEVEGLLDANRRLAVPAVPLRVGIVTSAGSEAYRDFAGTLERSGLRFELRLEHSQVQGTTAPAQIAAAIRRLHPYAPDVIVLVRGGGGRGDLAAFDSEEVARAIATSLHPVWTGIGHTGDRSVADEVSQRALVTPSACAEALCESVNAYCSALDARAERLARLGRQLIGGAVERLDRDEHRLALAARHQLERASAVLDAAARRAVSATRYTAAGSASELSRRASQLAGITRHQLSSASQQLGHYRRMLAAFDPKRQLARGWSLTRRDDGTIVRSVREVQVGDTLRTVVADGALGSSVLDILPARPEGPRPPEHIEERT